MTRPGSPRSLAGDGEVAAGGQGLLDVLIASVREEPVTKRIDPYWSWDEPTADTAGTRSWLMADYETFQQENYFLCDVSQDAVTHALDQLVAPVGRDPPICSGNVVADVAAGATPNGVICAHVSGCRGLSLRCGGRQRPGWPAHREQPLGLTAPLPSGIRMRHRPCVGGVNGRTDGRPAG